VPLPGVPRAGDALMAERRVAPPAVGTVALACGHCPNPRALVLIGPGRRLWFRERHGRKSRTLLVEGFLRARVWCDWCQRETAVGDPPPEPGEGCDP
jgi:hypothetical protein